MSRAMNHSFTSDESYPIFIPNQILDSEDLNAVVEYLNNQSHLTRSKFIGQGIAQGLTLTIGKSPNGETATIEISKGLGIAANGQLIIVDEDIQLAYYQSQEAKDENRDESKDEFKGAKFIELFKVNKNDSNRKPLTLNDADIEKRLKNSVLAVVRVCEEVPRSAPLLSYTEMGKDRQFYLRFILLPKDQIQIAPRTSAIASTLSSPTLRRFGYQNDIIRLAIITNATEFQQNYIDRCQEAITPLFTALQAVSDRIKQFPLLSNQALSRQTLNTLRVQFQNRFDTLKNTDYGIQYFYDYCSQIAVAHRELTEAIVQFMGDRPSAPDIQPNTLSADVSEHGYLLLGQIDLDSQGQPDSSFDLYRQYFVQKQIEDAENQPYINRIRFLFARLLRLYDANHFQLPSPERTPIKVTPSGDRSRPLSQQAIPYYLDYTSLAPVWNYEDSLKGTSVPQPAYASKTNFLIASLDEFEHYRIEGHLGRSCRDALTQIHTLQQNYNLSFDVLCLRLGTPPETAPQDHFFHRFTQLHPGLEHLGGVPRGGTLILVYTEQGNSDTIIADFSLPYPVEPRTLQLLAPLSLSLSIARTTFLEDDAPAEVTLLPNYGTVEGEGVALQAGKYVFQPGQLKGKIKGNQAEIVLVGRWGNHYRTQSITVNALLLSLARTTFTEDDGPVEISLTPSAGATAEGRGVSLQAGKFNFFPGRLKGQISGRTEVVITGKWNNTYTRTTRITVDPLILSIENNKVSFTEEEDPVQIQLSPAEGAIAVGRGVVEQAGKFYFDPGQLKGKINGNQESITIRGQWGEQRREKTVTVTAFTLTIDQTTFTEDDELSEIKLFPANGTVEGRGIENRDGKYYFVPGTLKGNIDRWVDIVITGKWEGKYLRIRTIMVEALVLFLPQMTFLDSDNRAAITVFPKPTALQGEGIERENDQYFFNPRKLQGSIDGQKQITIIADWEKAGKRFSREQTVTVFVPTVSIEPTTFTEDDEPVEIRFSPQAGAVVEGRGVVEQAGRFYFDPGRLKGKLSGNEEVIALMARWGNEHRTQTVTVQVLTLSIDKTGFTEEEARYRITVFPANGVVEGEGVVAENGQWYFDPTFFRGRINQRTEVLVTGTWKGDRRTLRLTVDPLILSIAKNSFTVDDDRVEIRLFPAGETVEGDGVVKDGEKFYFVPGNLKDQIRRRMTVPITGRWGNASRTQTLTMSALNLSIEKNSFIETDARAEITLFPDFGIAEGEGVEEQGGRFYFLPERFKGAIDQRREVTITGRWGDQSRTETVTVLAQRLATFWLGDVESGPDAQGNDVHLFLDIADPPRPLTPRMTGGTFRVFTTVDLEERNLDFLLQGEPLTLVPQNASEVADFTVEYTLPPEWGSQTSSILVHLFHEEPVPPDSDTETNLEAGSDTESSPVSPEPPVSELPTEAPASESNPTGVPPLESTADSTPLEVSPSEAPPPEVLSTETPSVETPSVEVPSAEAPPSETPSAEAPLPETPSSEVLSAEIPPSEVRSAEVFSPEVPSAEIPSSEALFSEVPSFEVPLSEVRSAEALPPEAPFSEAPFPEVLSAEIPSSEAPSAEALPPEASAFESDTSTDLSFAPPPSGVSAPVVPTAESASPHASIESSVSASGTSEIPAEPHVLPSDPASLTAASRPPLLQATIPPVPESPSSSTESDKPKAGLWQQMVHLLTRPIGGERPQS